MEPRAQHCEAYTKFEEIIYYYRIITGIFKLGLRAKKSKYNLKPYYLSVLYTDTKSQK